MSDDTPSDYAKWQHAENVLKGYRACVNPGDTGYDPPGSPGSAREESYRAGWKVACFDLAAQWLHKAGLHCRVRGEEDTTKLKIIGGTDYIPEVREGIGLFTGRTFVIHFNDEGNVMAQVSGLGQFGTDKIIERGAVWDFFKKEVDEAVDFVMETLGVM